MHRHGLVVVEAFADGFGEGDVRIGFLEKNGVAFAEEIGVQFVHAVAAGEDDLELRPRCDQDGGRSASTPYRRSARSEAVARK